MLTWKATTQRTDDQGGHGTNRVHIIGDANLFDLGQADIERVGASESGEAEHHGDGELHAEEQVFWGGTEGLVVRSKVGG